jgi:hypothetical protein
MIKQVGIWRFIIIFLVHQPMLRCNQITLDLISPSGKLQPCVVDSSVYSFKITADSTAFSQLSSSNVSLQVAFPPEFTSRSNISLMAIQWNQVQYQFQTFSTKYPILKANLPAGAVLQTNYLKVFTNRAVLTPFKPVDVIFSVIMSWSSSGSLSANTSIAIDSAILTVGATPRIPVAATSTCIDYTIFNSCDYFPDDGFLMLSSIATQYSQVTSVSLNGQPHSSYDKYSTSIYINGLGSKVATSPGSFNVSICSLKTHRTVSVDCSHVAIIGMFGDSSGGLAQADVCIETKQGTPLASLQIDRPERRVLESSQLTFSMVFGQDVYVSDTIQIKISADLMIGRQSVTRQRPLSLPKSRPVIRQVPSLGSNDSDPHRRSGSQDHCLST